MPKLRKLADLIREPLPPPECRPAESGARPYPVPEQFLPVIDFSPPSTGMVVLDPAWLRDPKWMRRNQAKVNKLFQENRVRFEGDPFRWQGRNEG